MKDYILYEPIYMKSPEQASPETESRLEVSGAGLRGWGMTLDKYDTSFWSDENVLTLIAVVAAQLYEFTENT